MVEAGKRKSRTLSPLKLTSDFHRVLGQKNNGKCDFSASKLNWPTCENLRQRNHGGNYRGTRVWRIYLWFSWKLICVHVRKTFHETDMAWLNDKIPRRDSCCYRITRACVCVFDYASIVETCGRKFSERSSLLWGNLGLFTKNFSALSIEIQFNWIISSTKFVI